MIQRFQTLWLLLASACAFLSMAFPFYVGDKVVNSVTNAIKKVEITGVYSILLIVSTVAVASISLVLIFLYKNRKRQMWLTLITFILAILNIFFYFMEIKECIPGAAGSTYSISMLFTMCIPVLLLLAVRGIYKDEKLIRSVNRLRE